MKRVGDIVCRCFRWCEEFQKIWGVWD